MKITPINLAKGVNDLIFRWQSIGLVSDSRQHKVYQRSAGLNEVTWGNDGYVLKGNSFASLQEYIDLVDSRQYSALMTNGDLFQISFSLKRNEIVKHRLCWYPCPIKLDQEDSDCGVIEAILDRMSSARFDDFLSRSPIRFDYDDNSFSEFHPKSHMHMISENCRIPVKTPLCLRMFSDFIFSNFYSDAADLENLNKDATTWTAIDCLTEGQKYRMHLNIFHPI